MAAFASPVKIEWPSEWRIPFIFSSPHSGRDYPEEFIESTKLEFTKLRQSEDFLVDELFACAPDYGAPLLSANFPRAYCDANREAFELDPHMYKTPLPDYVMTVSPRLASGIGTIPKVVGAGQEIYAGKLDFEDARQRINECYFPYHHALRQLLEEGRKKFGYIYLLDCHSMPPANVSKGGSLFRASDQRPNIILGNRYGTSCSPRLFEEAFTRLEDHGYHIGQNSPYAGGYITAHYGNPEKNIHALQIEINRALYMDQENLQTTDGFCMLKKAIAGFVQGMSANYSSLLTA
ncbi:N-formylglutamate amidohydrolase [Sneathiella sp. HT1-7]|uniref:N-formylglutamate amidohydrolase n=1 Tax=Sneathiella sp. HT1-7 TaxID=2887192 RepID=UPI001D14A82A|nr:N-formylglutamate amidohydrolase [Sneathiella sp. HT1-7]MCC3306479.1 N-formylglutamate amidohydrolase [Sneathiella sp. HT1-7]